MGWRMRKSIRLGKGVRLNVSKRGLGISGGVKGLRVGVGSRGAYSSVGIPGTGLYRVDYLGRKNKSAARQPSQAVAAPVVPLYGTPVQGSGLITVAWLLILGGAVVALFSSLGWFAVIAGVLLRLQQSTDPRCKASAAMTRAVNQYRQAVAGDNPEAYAKALECASTVIDLQPTATQAHFIAAVGSLEVGEPEQALAYTRQANSEEPQFMLLQVLALKAMEEYDEAIAIIRTMPPDFISEPPILVLRAELLLATDEPDLAIEILKSGPTRKKIKGDPTLLDLHYYLGRAYEASGKKSQAKRSYTRVMADTPGYRDVAERLSALS